MQLLELLSIGAERIKMAAIVELCRNNGIKYSVEIVEVKGKVESYKLIKANDRSTDCFLKFDRDTQIIVIDSVKSGTSRNDRSDLYKLVIEPLFQSLGVEYKYIKTESENSIRDFARRTSFQSGFKYDILFLSGDTSISEFINALATTILRSAKYRISILPVPLGSGNALATSLGFKTPLQALITYLNSNKKCSPLPLYDAQLPNSTSMIFFIILSLGFHANLLHCAEDPKYKSMGVERFQVASKTVFESYDLNVGIAVNGLQSQSYSYFAVIAAPNLEPTYKPSPKSSVLKKELHILGYKAGICLEDLQDKIMRGYHNKDGEDIQEIGTIYQCFQKNLELSIKTGHNAPKYRYDMCIDGYLLNLEDCNSKDNEYKILIRFIDDHAIMVYQNQM